MQRKFMDFLKEKNFMIDTYNDPKHTNFLRKSQNQKNRAKAQPFKDIIQIMMEKEQKKKKVLSK